MKAYNIVKTLVVLGFLFLAMPQLKAQTDFFIYNPEDFYINRDLINIIDGGGMTVEPFGGGAPLGSGLLIMSLAGAGYVAFKRRRLFKKGASLMLATLMLLGLTQCKKHVDAIENTIPNGVAITLRTDNGDRHGVNPDNGDVYFTDNDRLLISDGTRCIGRMKRTDGVFQGVVEPLEDGAEMYFYYLSNQTDDYPYVPTGIAVSLSDQTDRLPVMLFGQTTYYQGVTQYSCRFHNKCALVKFSLQSPTDETVEVGFFYTDFSVPFDSQGTLNPGNQGYIKLYSTSSTEKWAVVLPQYKIDAANAIIGGKNYAVSLPDITENAYITEGIVIRNSHNTFKIADDHEVYFSPGNLQYNGGTQQWRFAEHQYDTPNDYDPTTWVDMFPWGGWCEGMNPLDLSPGPDHGCYGGFVGTLNGHDDWTAMSSSEWHYLLFERPNAGDKAGQCYVGEFPGIIILPEIWELPDGCWFQPGLELSHEANNYTYDDWAKMEGAGAVFLPNAGFSTGVDGKQYYSSQGGYWTTSPAYEYTATYLFIKNHVAILKGDLPRCSGLSVRLVRTAPMTK